MAEMFRDCHSLKSLDLSNFNTSNINIMWNMFWNCFSLTSLNVSNFDISKVDSSLGHLFYNCKSSKS